MSVGAIEVDSVASEEDRSSSSLSTSSTLRNSRVDSGREGSVAVSIW